MPEIPQSLKKVTNRSYVFGDFDKDSTPNIDDKKPFDSKEKSTAQEVMLSEQLRDTKKHNEKFRDPTLELKHRLKKLGFRVEYRIKGTHSTIGKLKKDYLGQILDIGAIRVIVRKQSEIKFIADKIKSQFRVIKEHDYYHKSPKEHPYYKAIHLTILYQNKPFEIQVKTKGHNRIHKRTHAKYKTYHPLPPELRKKLMKESEELTRKEG
mgnify:CR=1 FL=1